VNRKSTYDLLSVIGAIVLFTCWIFQLSVLERVDKQLADIASAENLYRIYQSHNALFNAIIATQGDNKSTVPEIRRFQVYNYGLGLERLAQVTGTPTQIGYDLPMEDMQRYLERVQKNADALKEKLQSNKYFSQLLFTVGYGLGSCLALLGSILKLRLPEK